MLERSGSRPKPHQSVLRQMCPGLGLSLLHGGKRPAASVTNRPVPSVSRSVGTTTRVADVKKTAAPARSSPAKKGEKSSKPSSPKQQSAPVPESDAYFTIKTNRGKVKENSPITNVRISPIKFKESM